MDKKKKSKIVFINKRSWQIVTFEALAVSFIRITGTHNTANEVFHCVHFECPCDQDILTRYLEHNKVDSKQYAGPRTALMASPSQLQQQQSQSHESLPQTTTTTMIAPSLDAQTSIETNPNADDSSTPTTSQNLNLGAAAIDNKPNVTSDNVEMNDDVDS